MNREKFDAEAIRQLAAILTETGLTEIEVSTGEHRIRVARAHAPVASSFAAPAPAAPPATPVAAPPEVKLENHPGAVLSPMVGVAYLSPEPGATPYITIGQTVTEGQTVLLIEAMKTFNQIKAPQAGTVTRILIASGTPVEYGEPLLILEP